MYDAGDTKCVCVTRTRCDARAAYSRASEQRNLGALLELALARNALERRHRRVDLRVGARGGRTRRPRYRDRQRRRHRRRLAEGGGRRAVAQHRAPRHPVLRERRPARAVQVEDVHRLRHAPAVREPRRAHWPRVRHPRRQQPPRQPRHVHAADVAEPSQLAPIDVDVNGVEPQPLHQVLRRDVVLPHVSARHAAHRAQALRVEDAQPLQQHLRQAPALAAVEEDGEDERLVHRLLARRASPWWS